MLRKILFATLLPVMSLPVYSQADQSSRQVEVIPGYVAHGINGYNGEPIADYSAVSPLVPWFQVASPIEEIGVFVPGASNAGTITAQTDRSLLVATTRSFFDFFNPTGTIDPNVLNRPLGDIGSNYIGFTAVDDRIIPQPFSSASTIPSVYRSKVTNVNPTVGDWERISGKLTVVHKPNGHSKIKVTIRGAFPNGLYTLWEVGAAAPLTADETGYGIPLGGLPNVLMTNKRGCGYVELELPYDLTRACEAGAASCTSYVSAFYHWDGQAYGGSPAGTAAGAPTGVYAGNQIVWPTNGDVLIEPQNRFLPRRHGC